MVRQICSTNDEIRLFLNNKCLILIGNKSYAIKTLCLFSDNDKKAADNEITLMKMIDHSHIIKYYGDFRHSNEIRCILIEFCEAIFLKFNYY